MKGNILFIDTSNNKEVVVGLEINEKKDEIRQSLDTRKAQAVLPLIESLLKKHSLSLQDISGIEVNPGPGSFTGVRVGVSIANALGYLLQVPVNGKNVVEPIYQ